MEWPVKESHKNVVWLSFSICTMYLSISLVIVYLCNSSSL